MNIFREEALNHQTDSDYGEIVLPASFGLSISALTTLFIFLCLILFILYGSYTRKAHLSGIVMPSSGLVKITPQYAGYVTKLTPQKVNTLLPVRLFIISAVNISTNRGQVHSLL